MIRYKYILLLDIATTVLLGFIGCVCFHGSISGKFVFDDAEAIVNNKDVRLESPLLQLFKNDFWGTQLTQNSSHKSYRPLTVLSFRFNVWMSNGELQAQDFHFFNIFLHGISSALTFPMLCIVLKRKSVYDIKPLVSSLLFSVHPVHSEAVAGIVGRADLLCAIFSFLSIIIYSYATKLNTVNTVFPTFLSALVAGLAMLSKEQGITILGVCCAYDLIVVNAILPMDIISTLLKIIREFKIHRSGITLFKQSPMKTPTFVKKYHLMLLRQLIVITSGTVIIYFRCWAMGFDAPKFQVIDNPASFIDAFLARVVNYNYIYVLNFWIIICPDWLCFDWSMGCVPLIKLDYALTDLRIFSIPLFWLMLGGLFNTVLKCSQRLLTQNTLMALSFLIITFFPASNILFRVGFVIAERILYLPSVGFCMLVSIGLELLYIRFIKKQVLFIMFAILIIINISRCHQRSLDWVSEKRLFSSGLRVCPLNAKVHYNLAKTSFNSTVAIKHYREALRLNPEYEQALNNLANVLRDSGDINESERLLRKAISIRPDFAAAWMNLGVVLSNMKRYDEALSCYKTALVHRKKYPDCYYNLGNLYLSLKMYNEAYIAWKQATYLKPKHSIAWNNLIVMMDSLGELDKAEELALEALAILPQDSALHFNLANTLGKKSLYESAEHHFMLAIKLKPNQALYHTNLGVLYHRWKRYKDAENQYLHALSLNPDLANVEKNLKTVQKLLLRLNYNDLN